MKPCLALDLGTTTLAGRLLAETGEIISECQLANPQREVGADILMRLQRAHGGDGEKLQSLLVDGLRLLIRTLLEDSGVASSEVTRVVAAGNPGMSCLLQNLSVSSLLFPPHKPPYKELTHIPVNEIDLGLSSHLELFPLVSGFVGGDLVAALLWVESVAEYGDGRRSGTAPEVRPGTLLIDIGTNAELALWDGERWWATSAAAGPAFEGGNIAAGVTLADGAVTEVSLLDDRLQLKVAGNCQPTGLCGSGLAALIAAARQGGLIDATGRIGAANEVETNLGRYLVEAAGSWAIRFHRDAQSELLLTQDDVRNFQFAKGALRAGTQVLLERSGFAAETVSQVLVTGALGTALPVEVLKRVALLPEPMLDKTSFVRNGVLAGLQAYLAAADGQQRLADLVNTIQPFPLSGTPAFERLFLAALGF